MTAHFKARATAADRAAASAAAQIVGLHHVGITAEDPAALAQFYHDALGLQHVGGSDKEGPFGASAFLTSDPAKDSHQIAIFADPGLRHIAFKVGTLADLRAAYRRIVGMGLPIRPSTTAYRLRSTSTIRWGTSSRSTGRPAYSSTSLTGIPSI